MRKGPSRGFSRASWARRLPALAWHLPARTLMRHVTLALRTLFKTPFVTGVAVLSLALGIGANAAIFSLFDQILLRPLPVPDPDRLVNLAAPGPKPGSQSCGQAGDCDVVFSYPMFRDLERTQTEFSGLAAQIGRASCRDRYSMRG